MAHKLRNPGTFSHSCGEASISQLFEARPRFCKSGGICWIKFVACIAGDIHHDLLGHSPRPFVNPYQEQLINSEGSAGFPRDDRGLQWRYEPLRVCRRLQLLRSGANEQAEK